MFNSFLSALTFSVSARLDGHSCEASKPTARRKAADSPAGPPGSPDGLMGAHGVMNVSWQVPSGFHGENCAY